MNNKKSYLLKSAIVTGLLTTVLATASWAADAEPNPVKTLEYNITLAEDGKTYEIWMKPDTTPTPDMNLTAQVTLKIPADIDFQPTSIISAFPGAEWVESSRTDTPEEDADHNYVSFSFVSLDSSSIYGLKWKEDEEKLMFAFENESGQCLDNASIMADDDPFNIKRNSANTNPGNQFTNLGWGSAGDNNFKGVYGDAIDCK